MSMSKEKHDINEKELIEETRLSNSDTVSMTGNIFRIESKKDRRHNSGINEVNSNLKAILIVITTVLGTFGVLYIILTLFSLLSK